VAGTINPTIMLFGLGVKHERVTAGVRKSIQWFVEQEARSCGWQPICTDACTVLKRFMPGDTGMLYSFCFFPTQYCFGKIEDRVVFGKCMHFC